MTIRDWQARFMELAKEAEQDLGEKICSVSIGNRSTRLLHLSEGGEREDVFFDVVISFGGSWKNI